MSMLTFKDHPIFTLGIFAAMLAMAPACEEPEAFEEMNDEDRDAGCDYPDISGTWYQHAICNLHNLKIVSGYPDGTFRPQYPVRRAEFAVMVAKTFNLKNNGQKCKVFKDVPANHWAHAAICAANINGYLSGFPDGTFRPIEAIQRQEVAASLYKGRKLPPPGKQAKDNFAGTYSDHGQVSPWAREAAVAVHDFGALMSEPGVQYTYWPLQAATRGEVANVLYVFKTKK